MEINRVVFIFLDNRNNSYNYKWTNFTLVCRFYIPLHDMLND